MCALALHDLINTTGKSNLSGKNIYSAHGFSNCSLWTLALRLWTYGETGYHGYGHIWREGCSPHDRKRSRENAERALTFTSEACVMLEWECPPKVCVFEYLVLIWKAIEPLGGGNLLEKVVDWRWPLHHYSFAYFLWMSPLPPSLLFSLSISSSVPLSLSPLFMCRWRYNQPAPCACHHSFPAIKGSISQTVSPKKSSLR